MPGECCVEPCIWSVLLGRTVRTGARGLGGRGREAFDGKLAGGRWKGDGGKKSEFWAGCTRKEKGEGCIPSSVGCSRQFWRSREIRQFQMFIKLAFEYRMWRHFHVSSNHAVARQNCDKHWFSPLSIPFSQTKLSSLIDNYFRHKAPCGIRKLTAAFVSKIGFFSCVVFLIAKFRRQNDGIFHFWFSKFDDLENESLIQIQLMNIHVSECKYYCLHLVPKFGDVCDRQNWSLHSTDTANSLRH